MRLHGAVATIRGSHVQLVGHLKPTRGGGLFLVRDYTGPPIAFQRLLILVGLRAGGIYQPSF
jgi:hypothetical protein